MTSSGILFGAVNHLVPPETKVETPGAGPAFKLVDLAGKPILIVLRITDIIEQESILVSVWGSQDGQEWAAKPLFLFPERFYCGATPAALDLSKRPEIKFLQARWAVNRWGRGYPRPRFGFSIDIQEFEPGH